MKNKTRRPPLIIHPAPKQNQQDFLKTKLEADSPITASQPPTSQSHLISVPTCVSMIREYRQNTMLNLLWDLLVTFKYCASPLINWD